jgi:NAD(P)-dependent dehydrogenase (short-subunit alcohol dehydrogenase family)
MARARPRCAPLTLPTAIVTGGARGIGLAVATALADASFQVAVVDLEAGGASEGRFAYVRGDVADVDGHAALVRGIVDRLGPVHCLVNNAGVTSLARGDMLDLTPASFDRCVAVNLRGAFFLTQAVARAMIAADPDGTRSPYRSLVTIGSANAEILGLNRADYCMTKAGASMMSKLYAARLAPARIHAFEIRPGIIRTDMTAPAREKYDRYIADDGVPMQRWGEPADVGTAVATIARGLLPFATGEIVNVGGGMHLHRV